MRTRAERWLGGRVYTGRRGERRWIIERQVGGKRHSVTLRVDSEREALLELAAFDAAPEDYLRQREGRQRQDAVRLDVEHVGGFLLHLKEAKRSPGHVADAKRYLAAWDTALRNRDLRGLDGREVKKMLGMWTSAAKGRTIAFKSFCSWLVSRGDLDPTESPGRFLTVAPARRKHDAKGYTREAIEALYAALPTQPVRDHLCLQAKTGMHITEVARLARGDGTVRAVEGFGDIAGTVAFKHKTGQRKVISVDRQVLAAARRLQVRRSAPTNNTMREAVALACSKNQALQPINFGALRHSYATWLAECGTIYQPRGTGLAPEAIAQALGHTTARTTALHYLSVQVPPLYVVPLTLRHADDPP